MLDDADRARVVELFKQGLHKEVIATEIGCSVGGVYSVLAKAGLHTKVHRGSHGHSVKGAAHLHRLGG